MAQRPQSAADWGGTVAASGIDTKNKPPAKRRGRDSAKTGRIRQENRARILKAAEQVFAEKGFSGATTSAVAEKAGLPKANVHYYFRTKEALYREVIGNIVDLWLHALREFTEADDPAEVLTEYVRAKVMYSKKRPHASRIFANEIVHGAPVLKDYLATDLRNWVEEKSLVLRRWEEMGKMDSVDPHHLFFMLWASTQTYADFEVQISAVLGKRKLSDKDYEQAVETITHVVLKGLGVRSA
jgi:TetR/AcrR family transcriptional regulator